MVPYVTPVAHDRSKRQPVMTHITRSRENRRVILRVIIMELTQRSFSRLNRRRVTEITMTILTTQLGLRKRITGTNSRFLRNNKPLRPFGVLQYTNRIKRSNNINRRIIRHRNFVKVIKRMNFRQDLRVRRTPILRLRGNNNYRLLTR